MQFKQQKSFHFQENIKAIVQKDAENAFILLASGQVVAFNFLSQEQNPLFSVVERNHHYTDGGFSMEDEVVMLTQGEFIVVANAFKTHAYLYDIKKEKIIHFRREDYYAKYSFFPLAFVDYQKVEKYFLFSKAWNRVDIIDLKNLKNITATKSLIEDRSYDEYEKNPENTHFFPPELDYFYGETLFSPSGKHFLSAGWCWGSSDYYCLFNTQEFIENQYIQIKNIFAGEHNARAVCWKDDETILLGYEPLVDETEIEEEGAENEDFNEEREAFDKKNPYQILFFGLNGKVKQKISVPRREILYGKWYFSTENQCLVSFDKSGTTILNLHGEILWEHSVVLQSFDENFNMAFAIAKDKISIYKLEI